MSKDKVGIVIGKFSPINNTEMALIKQAEKECGFVFVIVEDSDKVDFEYPVTKGTKTGLIKCSLVMEMPDFSGTILSMPCVDLPSEEEKDFYYYNIYHNLLHNNPELKNIDEMVVYCLEGSPYVRFQQRRYNSPRVSIKEIKMPKNNIVDQKTLIDHLSVNELDKAKELVPQYVGLHLQALAQSMKEGEFL